MKLEEVKAFTEKQEKEELEFLSMYYGSEKGEISPLGEVAFLVHQFGGMSNEEEVTEFLRNVKYQELKNNLKFAKGSDEFRHFVTKFGKFSAKRMSDDYKSGLDRLYFKNLTLSPHTALIKIMSKNKNLDKYDFVTGSVDMFHFMDTERSTGVWTSWIETPNFALNPYLNLVMPKKEYYYLFDVHAFNRIKGADIVQDLQNPRIKKEIMKPDNREYLLARADLVKKFGSGQMGE